MRLTGSRFAPLMRLRLTFLVVLALAVAAALIFFPWGWSIHPGLRLVALDGAGRFDTTVSIPRAWADTTDPALGDAIARLPLVLAVSNAGRRPGAPSVLNLSVPSRFRVVANDGSELTSSREPDNPMTRYEIKVESPQIEPGRMPIVLPSLDTLWIEPLLPSFYCIALGDSVPDFIPAPTSDVKPLSQLAIFYSFAGGNITNRQTGLLGVKLDPSLLHREAAAQPPVFPTEFKRPQHPLPAFESIRAVGNRRADCGDPEQPMEIVSHEWDTPDGGRFFVLDYGGKPRKYMFDLNRDSIIELEMWDSDGDGKFDAKRAAHLPIPPFLLPLRSTRPLDPRVFASLSPDSLGKLDPFQRGEQPYVPRTKYPEANPVTDVFHQAVAFEPAKYRELPEFPAQFHYKPLAVAPTPDSARKPVAVLPQWGPQFRYTPLTPAQLAAAQAEARRRAAARPQPQPGPIVAQAAPEKPYERLPEWGPQFHYKPLKPRVAKKREDTGPKLLGVPTDAAERRREAERERERERSQNAPAETADSSAAPPVLGDPVPATPVPPNETPAPQPPPADTTGNQRR